MNDTTHPVPSQELPRHLDDVLGAYYEAVDQGAVPDRREWLRRYPELHDELAEFFDDQDQLLQVVAPLKRAIHSYEPTTGAERQQCERGGNSRSGLSTEVTLAETPEQDASPPATGTTPQELPNLARTRPPQSNTQCDPCYCQPDDVRPGQAPSSLPCLCVKLGDYDLIRPLGQGAMGMVYEARQISLNRPVALKMIRAGMFASEADLHRFQNEAEAVALLDHPRIVPVYAVGDHQGCHFFTMKLIKGGSLAERLEDFRTEPRATARLMIEVARAIQHAHQRGILHRDLKPGNILLDEDGQPHVTDFGLAKRFQEDSSLTQSGAIMGTPSYMAPEQASGHREDVTTLTDVYGLGAVLYALLTGQPPFIGANVMETIDQVRQRLPENPTRINPHVPRDLETICLKCLEKDPARRYPSAEALAVDLEHWSKGEPIAARPVSRTARAWMWCRRNPGIACLLLALASFALVSSWQWLRAESLLRQANRDASRTAIEQALSICNQGETGRGLLQLAEALRTAPTGSEDLKHAIRANIVAWSPYTHRLKATLALQARQFPAGNRPLHQRSARYQPIEMLHAPLFLTVVSPDGRTIVTGHTGEMAGMAQLWDAETGEPRGAPIRHGAAILTATFSPDSRWLLTGEGGQEWTARLWDARSGAPVGLPLQCKAPVRCVAFSPDGKTILTGCTDGMARIWNATTCAPQGRPLVHGDWVVECLFRNDGKAVLTACMDGRARLWEFPSGRLIGEMPGLVTVRGSYMVHMRRQIAFSGDGSRILTGTMWNAGQQQAVQLWDGRTAKPVGLSRPPEGTIRGVALSQDGRIGLMGGNEKLAHLLDARTGAPLGLPLRHQDQVLAVALSPDGTLALTGSADWTARIWNVASNRPLGDPLRHQNYVFGVNFLGDSRSVLTAGQDEVARIWALALPWPSGRPVARNQVDTQRLDQMPGLATAPDGTWIVTAHDDGTAQVRDATTSTSIGEPLVNQYAVISVAVSPDGRSIATGCSDGTARVWSAGTRRPVGKTMMHQGPVRSLVFSPDGWSLLSGSSDGTARLWDAMTGIPIGPPLEHGKSVGAVAYSPGGGTLLTRTDEGAMLRWERPPEASGPDERFILWTQVLTGATVDSSGTIQGLDLAAWTEAKKRLESLGGPPGQSTDGESLAASARAAHRQDPR